MTIETSRGKVLRGSSSINMMAYSQTHRLDCGLDCAETRGLDIAIKAKRQVADAAARAEAKAIVEHWNDQGRRPRHVMVANDPSCADRREAVARRVSSTSFPKFESYQAA
jgi:hypothetical protein